jgi:hypothetical protein
VWPSASKEELCFIELLGSVVLAFIPELSDVLAYSTVSFLSVILYISQHRLFLLPPPLPLLVI